MYGGWARQLFSFAGAHEKRKLKDVIQLWWRLTQMLWHNSLLSLVLYIWSPAEPAQYLTDSRRRRVSGWAQRRRALASLLQLLFLFHFGWWKIMWSQSLRKMDHTTSKFALPCHRFFLTRLKLSPTAASLMCWVSKRDSQLVQKLINLFKSSFDFWAGTVQVKLYFSVYTIK